jgi:hypothetical protein
LKAVPECGELSDESEKQSGQVDAIQQSVGISYSSILKSESCVIDDWDLSQYARHSQAMDSSLMITRGKGCEDSRPSSHRFSGANHSRSYRLQAFSPSRNESVYSIDDDENFVESFNTKELPEKNVPSSTCVIESTDETKVLREQCV